MATTAAMTADTVVAFRVAWTALPAIDAADYQRHTADPTVPLPPIDPDARRRRLTALVNAASLARETPAVYVVEDAHWIDEVSESMLAEFLTVIPQTPSLVLVTYRPRIPGRVDPSDKCPHRCPCAAE
jgi:predicted ATPase